MLDSSPPEYTETKYHWHSRFHFSNDIVDFQVDDTRFRVHEHFLSTYSSEFRERLVRHRDTNNNGDPDGPGPEQKKTSSILYLHDVSVLEFESLLTFFYESWKRCFSMPVSNWVALLSIAHRFKFTDAESRARREVFQRGRPPLDSVMQISLAEKHSVPIKFIVPALEDLVRRSQPLQVNELRDLSREMTARICTAREKYVHKARMFASESWLKQVASNIVQSLWPDEKAPTLA